MSDKDISSVNALTASGLVSASLLGSLIGELAGKGILSDMEVRQIYDQALLMIEEQQANANDTDLRDIYDPARKIIEDQLRN